MDCLNCCAYGNRAFFRPSRPVAQINRCNASFRPLYEIDIKTGIKHAIKIENGASITGPIPPNLEASDQFSLSIKSIFLPRGWPHSVTNDYLRYQLWTFPSHVTGWISSCALSAFLYFFEREKPPPNTIAHTHYPPPHAALAGSSMLKALGVSAGPAGTVGFSAAIKWVTKDGVGAIGRLFVGSRLGSFFDEDPKKWRMVAEGMTTLGLSLEIATQLSPSNFIVLAGSGTLVKAIGKGMGRPCFRVIQTHFSASNNVGDVAAKEEVWEVVAQMLGLAISVGILSVLEATGAPEVVIPVWASVHAVHVVLRYAALQQLCFPFPNTKRGTLLVRNHVENGSVLSVDDANTQEGIQGLGFGMLGFLGSNSELLRNIPCMLGCSIQDIVNVCSRQNDFKIYSLMELYHNEQYILVQDPETSTVLISLKEDATPRDILRSLWQATWIDAMVGQSNNETASLVSVDVLGSSLLAMQKEFPDLESKAGKLGWKLNNGVYSVGNYRLVQ